MGHLAKLVQRVRGARDVLRPAIDRWHIARAPEPAGNAAALPFEDRIYPRRTEGTEADPVTRAAPHVRPAQNWTPGIASAERVSPPSAGKMTDETIAVISHLPGRNATIAPRGPRIADGRAASHRTPVAHDALERSQPERGRGDARLLPRQAVRPPTAVRNAAGTFARVRSESASNEPGPVYVHIGRIDVRAVSAPAVKAPVATRPAMRKPSLEAHLRARDRGTG